MTSLYRNELAEVLYKYMRENYLCDVTIVVCGGVCLSAHSVVLATVSNKLRAAFERTHAGGPARRPNWGYRLTIEECSPESVQAVLQFVYTGSVRFFRGKEVKEQPVSFQNQTDIMNENTNLSGAHSNTFIKTAHKDKNTPSALGILSAGQKLGLDPVKLASCLKAMMEDAPLDIEDTTPYVLTDEDVILDIVDKDPNNKTSFNLVETMCVTSQMFPITDKDKGSMVANYLDVDLLGTKANISGKKFLPNMSFAIDPPDASNSSSRCSIGFSPPGDATNKPRDSPNSNLTAYELRGLSIINSCKFDNRQNDKKITHLEKHLLNKLSTKTSEECRSQNMPANDSSKRLPFSDVYSSLKSQFTINSSFNQKNSNLLLQTLDSVNVHPNDVPSVDAMEMRVHGRKEDSSLEREERNRIESVDYETNDMKFFSKNTKLQLDERRDKTGKSDVIKIPSKDIEHSETTCTISNVKDVFQSQGSDRPYHCDICGRSFARRYTAVEHKRLHSGEKPYQCESCGKRFTTCGDLTKHRRSQHGSIKPHVCSICGKEMNTGREVADHKRLHEGGNRCPVCFKTFTRLHNMKEHLRGTHQGHRLFSCPYCDKKFVYSGSLRFHKKQHRLHLQDETDQSSSSAQNLISTSGDQTKLQNTIDLVPHEPPQIKLFRNVKNLKSPRPEDVSNSDESVNAILAEKDHQKLKVSNKINEPSEIKHNNDKTYGVCQSTHFSLRKDGILNAGALNNCQERVDMNSMDALQDQVLVDLALSGMIGFGTSD